MDGKYTKLISSLFRMARQDPQYAKMGEKYNKMESQVSEILSRLPQEAQDVVWAYICHSEEMNWRMLEIICEKMEIWRA